MKRGLACLFAVCMLLSACASEDTQDTAPDTKPTEPETTATTETVPTEPQLRWEKQKVFLCVRQTMTQHDGSGSSAQEFEYDEYGNRIGMWPLEPSGKRSPSYTEYSYDQMGNLISSVSVDAQGNPGSRYEYTYDENGNVLSELYYNAEGAVRAETYYVYNADGWLAGKTEKAYYFDPVRDYQYAFAYEPDYSACTVSSVMDGEAVGYTNETYDADGRVTRADNYAQDDSWKSTITYAYDAAGNILKEEHYTENDLQADYDIIYTYDENGCLISKNVDYYYGYIMEYTYGTFEISVPIVE